MKLFALFLFTFFGFCQSKTLVSTSVLLSQNFSKDFGDVAAGGDSFGGGDSVDARKHTAWFYGNDPINVCYHLTSNFGLSSGSVESSLRQSISMWQSFFTAKKIGETLPQEERINTNLNLKSQCEGGEDLVLYFGTGPIFGNLEDLKMRQTLSRPVAYVNKTHMSEDFKWSKGYIRFVGPELYKGVGDQYFPNWSKGESFQNMLLHELGHVLGFIHSDGTIMRKDLSKLQFIDDVNHKMEVETEDILIKCKSCKKIYLNNLSTQKIKKLELVDDKKILIHLKGAVEVAQIENVLIRNDSLNILSHFQLSSYENNEPYFYFIKYQGKHYTLELGGKSLTMRLNGEMTDQFNKDGL